MALPPPVDQHARTEPSTPLRARTSTATSLSAPLSSKSRLHFVSLPPDELSSILGQPPSSALRKLTEHSTPQNHKSSHLRQTGISQHSSRRLLGRSSGPNSRHESVFSTPHSRRLSDHLTVRRRRRSSAGATYVSGYQGPITKDFLRTFSRALLHDQQRTPPEYESEKVFQALDNEHRLHLQSPKDQSNYNEFDYSLPLPSDDAMRSPPLTAEFESASPVGTPKSDPPRKEKNPAFKSYLERILDARKRSSLFENETPNDVNEGHHGMKDIISTSKFVIENTIQGLPDFGFGKQTQSQADLKLAEPLAINETAVHTDSEESSDNAYKAPEWTPPRRAHRPSFNLQKTPEYESSDHENAMNLNLESMSMLPENDEVAGPEADDGLFDPPVEPSSDLGIILGHFTIEDGDIEDLPQYQLPRGSISDDDVLQKQTFESKISKQTTRGPQFHRQSKRPHSSGDVAIPKHLMRGMVSTVSRLPLVDRGDEPAAKKPKIRKLTPALLQVVLKGSNDFLEQLMSTLKAYAEHRGSDKISIQDTVLYLNRLKMPSASSYEMRDVAKLAHDLFPLETLVSLNNSLQQSTLKKLKEKDHDMDDDEKDTILDQTTLPIDLQRQESFSETETSPYDDDDDDNDLNADDDYY